MEKRGFTGKLNIDFRTEGVLEVFMTDTWFRVIATELDPSMDLDVLLYLVILSIMLY